MPGVEQCPECKGRRLRATREERDHTVDGALYTGFASVVVCKTCGATIKSREEEAAFVRDVEEVARGVTVEGEPPRKIRKRR